MFPRRVYGQDLVRSLKSSIIRRRFHVASRLALPYQSTGKPRIDRKMRRDLNFALVGGILLAASYVSLTKFGLHSDSGASMVGSTGQNLNSETAHRDFSTTSRASTTSSTDNGGTSATQGKHQLPIFTDVEVDRRLHRYEESYLVHRGKGVARYDICQLPSNNPIEDDRVEKIVQVPIQDQNNGNAKDESDWYFWSVMDGHAGWTTSAKLRDELTDSVLSELSSTAYKAVHDDTRLVPTSDSIDRAIKTGFLKLDNQIVNTNVQKLLQHPESKSAAAELLMPALSGSCALMSFYDSHTKNLKVAVTGDSRALLGSLNDKGEWTVDSLSIDQTGRNPTEVGRLLTEHPNEPNVVRNGRVLGSLEPARAFGDARYKWSPDLQRQVYNKFFGRQMPSNLKTPPYVTAQPEVTTHKIDPSKHDFLVMASDGLYEMLSNEEIVGLVVRWMENQKMVQPKTSFVDSIFHGSNTTKLPKVIDVSGAEAKSQKQPFRKSYKGNTGNYMLKDSNVATHIIRNALSNGGNKDNVNLLVSIPSPLSRRYRDDLTVTVVFFSDEKSPDGSLEINRKATHGGLDVAEKSKL